MHSHPRMTTCHSTVDNTSPPIKKPRLHLPNPITPQHAGHPSSDSSVQGARSHSAAACPHPRLAPVRVPDGISPGEGR